LVENTSFFGSASTNHSTFIFMIWQISCCM
jgi:hypothetical protein